ncbi:hypothetical protein ABZ468_07850 [Streptomyces sp. NPDC005708]|uniref:hypothetical protein n=1 Tax=Streptomyces sp. NPDC005708 TaxID=3154564 RepID=UPI0033F5C590
MTEEALVEWLTSMAPVLTPLCGLAGVLGGGWLVYRQTNRRTDVDARTAEAQTFVSSVETVTQGFTQLLEQQRAANTQTLERVASLEARQDELARKVDELQEEQRRWRRWKAAAVEYIHQLRGMLAQLSSGTVPAPPRELAEDLADGAEG